ncbi:MAG: hypothetical protein F6K40_29485 [Okeania sp. SIO3I5]|uniref:hypothetical protein n=1 Tax=Okeania sp. SIO3I5 TaxID=2607805 RepID=UPI0013BDF0CC|nr:hypothetical protein [Okeania sp. SIO3I5]NEQ40152.1 hypothetical protein [Okeania sp. SIO3I5]
MSVGIVCLKVWEISTLSRRGERPFAPTFLSLYNTDATGDDIKSQEGTFAFLLCNALTVVYPNENRSK